MLDEPVLTVDLRFEPRRRGGRSGKAAKGSGKAGKAEKTGEARKAGTLRNTTPSQPPKSQGARHQASAIQAAATPSH